jgi:prephenate dehydratase
MAIGYLGPAGTFTEQALHLYLAREGSVVPSTPENSIVDLFEGLKAGKYSQIIVPIENSIEGSVNATMDLLYQYEGLFLNKEIVLPIHQCLLAKTQLPLDQIVHIASHPQALAQCRDYLHDNLPKAQTHLTPSTAAAAEWATNGTLETEYKSDKIAVIGNKELIQHYPLVILAESINDKKNNLTRFLVVSTTKTPSTGCDKTSIVVSAIKDKPGGLVELLGEFSKRNINLSRIVSRPTQTVLGEYLFFIDCDGHQDDDLVKEALIAVKKNASVFKLLGSYQQDIQVC